MTVRTYDYDHRVTFDETNVVGNVYFASHLHWQGHCRELFLADHAPEVIDELQNDLLLVTLRCEVDYLSELRALDTVRVRMRLIEMVQNRLRLGFDYLRLDGTEATTPVARGGQEIACMRRAGRGMTATPVPDALVKALAPYGESQR